MIQNGKTLSTHNEAIWKGTYTNNGTLLKIHENSFTIGYSNLLSADGEKAGVVKFGNGVFYNGKDRDNKVYAGAPTAAGAVPVFAGIVVREPAIASGYPALNDEVAAFQKGMLAKEGFVIYKDALVATVADGKATLPAAASNTYENVSVGASLAVSAADGVVYFTEGAAKADGKDAIIGKVVAINPDDKSVTAYISPAFYI